MELYTTLLGSWRKFLDGIEMQDFHHMTEADIQSRLFQLCSEELETFIKVPEGLVHTQIKIMGRPVDLVIVDPLETEFKAFACVEIKNEPDPNGIKEDLTKLVNYINHGETRVGILVTMAFAEYRLREKLKERGIFDEFGLKEEERTSRSYVEWDKLTDGLRRPIDALFVSLGDIPSADTTLEAQYKEDKS